MAKKQKKRNKKYNPHKVMVKTLEYTATLEDKFGFDPSYLAEWVDRSNENIRPVEVADEDVFDVRPLAAELHYRQTGWREPEYLVQSRRPMAYRNVLLDNCMQYARMLSFILGVDDETIVRWKSAYEKRVLDAWQKVAAEKS